MFYLSKNIIYNLICTLLLTAGVQAQQKMEIWERPLQYKKENKTVDIKKISNLFYQTSDSFRSLDLYLPLNNMKPSSLVIMVHGGPISPNIPVKPKDWRLYQDYGRLCASKGIATAIINHRLFNERSTNDSYNDIRSALQFLKQQASAYNIDTAQITLWMFSGAAVHLQQFIADEIVEKEICFYGVYTMDAIPSIKKNISIFLLRCGKDKATTLASTDFLVKEILSKNMYLEVVNHPTGLHGFDILQNGIETDIVIDKAINFINDNYTKR